MVVGTYVDAGDVLCVVVEGCDVVSYGGGVERVIVIDGCDGAAGVECVVFTDVVGVAGTIGVGCV